MTRPKEPSAPVDGAPEAAQNADYQRSEAAASVERPFWSSDEGSSACDYVAEGAVVACDAEPVKYEVQWKDGERSSACEAHGAAVDRNLVDFIKTQGASDV